LDALKLSLVDAAHQLTVSDQALKKVSATLESVQSDFKEHSKNSSVELKDWEDKFYLQLDEIKDLNRRLEEAAGEYEGKLNVFATQLDDVNREALTLKGELRDSSDLALELSKRNAEIASLKLFFAGYARGYCYSQ